MPNYCMTEIIKFFGSNISLIIGVSALVTAFFQWRRSISEANAFRQQLVSILHHAEGLSSALRSIAYSGPDLNQTFSTVNDVRKAVNSAFQTSEALFFGLLEIKVGGKPIKNDIDRKYAEWAELNLDQKMFVLKRALANNPAPIAENPQNNNGSVPVPSTGIKKLLSDIKIYFKNRFRADSGNSFYP